MIRPKFTVLGQTMARNTGAGRPKAGNADAEIGAKIRAARMERGMTQEVLATAIGVTLQQLGKYENGQNRLSAVRLRDLCEVLLMPPDRLLSVGRFSGPKAAGPRPGRLLLQTTQQLQSLPKRELRLVATMVQGLLPAAAQTTKTPEAEAA